MGNFEKRLKYLETELSPPEPPECPECAAREETPKIPPGEKAVSCPVCGEIVVFTLWLGEADLLHGDEKEEVSRTVHRVYEVHARDL